VAKPLGIKFDFFLDRAAIGAMLDEHERRAFMRIGGIVRKSARRLIRKPRRKKRHELNQKERVRYEIALRKHKRGQGPKPELPHAPADRGKPPRNRTGLLRDHIYFYYNPIRHYVDVGPADLMPGDVPGDLELGRGVAAHPFMAPAVDANGATIETIWQSAVV